jgi:hypothetical protein
MKKTILALAVGCVLIATLGHHYAKPVMAQVRAALTQNIDERGRNPYSQELSCFSNTSGACSVSFPNVPANMRLVVEHINVSVSTTTPIEAVEIIGSNVVNAPLLTLQGKDFAGKNLYIANQPLLFYFSAGEAPAVEAYVLPGNSIYVAADITLTGYLVNLNE